MYPCLPLLACSPLAANLSFLLHSDLTSPFSPSEGRLPSHHHNRVSPTSPPPLCPELLERTELSLPSSTTDSSHPLLSSLSASSNQSYYDRRSRMYPGDYPRGGASNYGSVRPSSRRTKTRRNGGKAHSSSLPSPSAIPARKATTVATAVMEAADTRIHTSSRTWEGTADKGTAMAEGCREGGIQGERRRRGVEAEEMKLTLAVSRDKRQTRLRV